MSSNNSGVGFRAFDGETYGSSHGYDDPAGEFKRNSQGPIRVLHGPEMVAEHLARVLRTPAGTTDTYDGEPPRGSDPYRPAFGLDQKKMMSNTGGGFVNLRQALIEAIGPDAIPWVERLDPQDITVGFDAGNRVAGVQIELELADGTPLSFDVDFQALLGREEPPNVNVPEGAGDNDGDVPPVNTIGGGDRRVISGVEAGEWVTIPYGESWEGQSPLSVGGKLSVAGELSVSDS